MRWLLKRSKIDTKEMAKELGIREATACVLANRALLSRKQTYDFLMGKVEDLPPAFLMKDMERAVKLLASAIEEGKKIAVYGDYDVDGIMSTSILYLTLLHCGADVIYYVPHRQKEGYGLNISAVEQLAGEGVGLLLTCDNGVSALAEVERAKDLGLTVVVLDHHEPGFLEEDGERRDLLPKADALVDPKQRDCSYPFSALCAGGLAYKFACALLRDVGKQDSKLEKQLLSFAAIATVCDIVDLLEENRILVKAGLEEIQKTENIGLRALIQATGLGDKTITEYHLGFIIGPCINATGRLESGAQAVELFTTTIPERGAEIAKVLTELNAERKQLTEDGAKRAYAMAEKYLDQRVLVLYDDTIHESIAGIVAGRVKERFYRPVILITGSEDGAKGSGRSIAGYHLFDALYACRHLFTRFGGHAMAAGLSMPPENISLLREGLNETCKLTEEEMTPVLRLEKQLEFGEVDLNLAKELKALAPFGKENPSPVFASKGVLAERIDFIGKEKNILRFMFKEEKSGIRLSGISFDGYTQFYEGLKELYPTEECDKIINNTCFPVVLDLAYNVDINTYMGKSNIQLMIKDFRFVKQGG